jgi:Fur family transcriptional regulator, ferric uptake regulator
MPAARALPSVPSSQLIRAAGVKVTRGRVRVLEALLASARPCGHGDLEVRLAGDSEPAMDRVTLYRVLDSLVDCGLALKAVDARGVFRYSAVATHRQHAGHVHFRCLACGAVYCLSSPPPSPPRLPRGFRLSELELDVRGTCADCAGTGDRP